MVDIIAGLKAGKNRIKIIKFPGTDDDIGISVLTESEVQEAAFAADMLFKAKSIEINDATANMYNAEVSSQVLCRALVKPDVKKPDGSYERLFKNVDEWKALVSRGVKDILTDEYNAFENEVNPSPIKLSEEEFAAIFEALKKSPENGNALSFRMQSALITYLASRP